VILPDTNGRRNTPCLEQVGWSTNASQEGNRLSSCTLSDDIEVTRAMLLKKLGEEARHTPGGENLKRRFILLHLKHSHILCK
jgi:hypothetical protein